MVCDKRIDYFLTPFTQKLLSLICIFISLQGHLGFDFRQHWLNVDGIEENMLSTDNGFEKVFGEKSFQKEKQCKNRTCMNKLTLFGIVWKI